ncbi:EMILIN-1-A-like [Mytilus trossulus]|uniref:EMILIN-1-A-like n=1 Tax=Mytilus trossulus TaxID=6551 RepID=UPI0030067424
MVLRGILFLLFVITIMKYAKGQNSDNSSTVIPLLDTQNMPLVALFDTTKLNQVLKIAIQKEVEDTMNQMIQKEVEDIMNQMIPRIKQAVIADIGNEPGKEQERPAFTASLTSSKNLASSEVVIFDKVWLNMGAAYNQDTGVFTAPKTGLYSISTTVMSYYTTMLHCDLWKNNQKLVRAFGTKLSTGTLNVVVALKKSDTVYVKHAGGREQIYGNHRSTFSGYLITE